MWIRVFLLSAYDYLLNWHREYYVSHGPSKFKNELDKAADDEWRLTIAERKRILSIHIFGVDVDPQAVETTKLSLLLKVLEGESAEALGQTLALWHDGVLPDLDRNIRCGNSLCDKDVLGWVTDHMYRRPNWRKNCGPSIGVQNFQKYSIAITLGSTWSWEIPPTSAHSRWSPVCARR